MSVSVPNATAAAVTVRGARMLVLTGSHPLPGRTEATLRADRPENATAPAGLLSSRYPG